VLKEEKMDICFMVYWGRVNDDVFETCINTFRKHSNAHLQVHSDDPPFQKYGIEWVIVPREKVIGRRALCKIEQLHKLVHQLKDGDRLIVSDVDMYFMDDPFIAFDEVKIAHDIGITTRCHPYRYPVNGGFFCFKISSRIKRFMDFHLEQCTKPTWKPYVDFREKWHHKSIDWEVGQDFLCTIWKERQYIDNNFIVMIKDLGWKYNFCPNTDIFGVNEAGQMIKKAYKEREVKVLHLKSELKLCIYDGYMEDAITTRCNGKYIWM